MKIKDALFSQQLVTIATQLHNNLVHLQCDFNHCFLVSDFIDLTLKFLQV